MLSLHQLRCFLTTYEHGSKTGAAEELGYAQPSVSEQIRALEKSLGADLFRRVGRGVVPTTGADELTHTPNARSPPPRTRDGWPGTRARWRQARSGSACSAPPGCTPGPGWSPTCWPATPASAWSWSARTPPT